MQEQRMAKYNYYAILFHALLLGVASYGADPPAAAPAGVASEYLNPHNAARAAVGLASMRWDPTVAAAAQRFTDGQKKRCQLSPEARSPYGQNLFKGSAGRRVWTPTDAVTSWLAGKQFYDHNTNTCQPGKDCGEYTQIVWSSSTSLGCGSSTCSDGSTLIACDYNPPGNIVGQKPF